MVRRRESVSGCGPSILGGRWPPAPVFPLSLLARAQRGAPKTLGPPHRTYQCASRSDALKVTREGYGPSVSAAGVGPRCTARGGGGPHVPKNGLWISGNAPQLSSCSGRPDDAAERERR